MTPRTKSLHDTGNDVFRTLAIDESWKCIRAWLHLRVCYISFKAMGYGLRINVIKVAPRQQWIWNVSLINRTSLDI
jgi:hypothetical protein